MGAQRPTGLARLLGGEAVDERPLDSPASRDVGLLAARTGLADVVDGHVAVLALGARCKVVTSDPDDLLRWGVAAEDVVHC